MNKVCSSENSDENYQIESNYCDSNNEDAGGGFSSEESEYFDTLSHESDQIESNCIAEEVESVRECSTEIGDHSGNFDIEEEETSKLVFKFQYQSWNSNFSEEFKSSFSESNDFEKRDTVSTSTNKYEFFSQKNFSQFLDETEAPNFTVKECFVHSDDHFPLENQVTGFLSGKKSMPESSEGTVNTEIVDNFSQNVYEDEISEKFKGVVSIEKKPLESYADNFLSDDDFICSSSESDSISSLGDGFLSDTYFGTTTEADTLENNEEQYVEDLDFGDEKSVESLDFGYEPDDFAEEDQDIMDELEKIEEEQKSSDSSINSKQEESVKNNSKSLTTFDNEDSNRFDTLWEHQDLIEQLKMELKKVRATGLPTILEDSESPRIMEDLKPWKIDEKFQNGRSTTNELPKFYKSYRERMRKFDILNYQKMYALGLLQSKDPLQSLSSHKNASSSSITCILPRGFRRRKNIEADPMNKFIRELYNDLEMVYVGQLCLSWEFLQWEYEKALKIWESDQYGLLRFNEVAGEFQQFQVLLQRFIENEPFQGPRVENYARNRCAMRSLLQVPVIREDKAKDKKKFRKSGDDNDGITSDMLVEILEESIRTIWRFIRADKDASSLTIKGLKEHHVELQDPADSQLLVDIRMDLQKKEKRLREILRSGSCILKKFKRHNNEDETDPVLYFFSQVDMKLVCRVLNMSRITTDQLAWCRSKLNKINFVNRRIQVEPSFLLFPS